MKTRNTWVQNAYHMSESKRAKTNNWLKKETEKEIRGRISKNIRIKLKQSETSKGKKMKKKIQLADDEQVKKRTNRKTMKKEPKSKKNNQEKKRRREEENSEQEELKSER